MQRLKRIVHRRRSSSNGDASVVTLSVPKDELKLLAVDHGVAPQKSGILLKYTNVLKRWKPRYFQLENGVLIYRAPADDSDDEDQPSPTNDPVKAKKKRSKAKRILRRAASKDEKERDIKGSINLQFAVVSPDESDDCRFAIDVGHDVYHVKADNSQQRDEWVDALKGSNMYFRGLIQKAIARAKEAANDRARRRSRSNEPNGNDESSLQSRRNGETLSLANPEASEDSDESFLEDDGLKEAEESRKALISELRRVLARWTSQWFGPKAKLSTNDQLVNILSETFSDASVPPNASASPPLDIAQGLIDLVAWCLHVVQTNDEMFDRRLKADLTRLMANGLPVFPTSPLRELPSLPFDEEEDTDDEYFDALSRAASIRTSLMRPTLSSDIAIPPAVDLLTALDRLEESVDEKETEQRAVSRVTTAAISPGYKPARTSLPALSKCLEKPNVFSILKDAVGKDLSKITFPIGLNEPMSFLQRLAEDIEYCELLDEGAKEKDPNRRMMYVAAMIISHYSSTQGRIAKPFNPLLGETACLVRPDKGNGVRFIAEQVSHHPPISACYAEGSGASWKYYNAIEVKHKFWGKSMEVFPTGLNHIEFPEYGDHYVFEQVTSCVHNIVIGRMWLDNYGELEIVNRTNGGRCVINFSKTGWMSDAKSFASVKATIYDAKGKPKIKLGGNWTKSVYEVLPHGKRNVLWNVEERPPQGASQTYNLTKWAITLNEQVQGHENAQIPPTDSRRRPDQRALENGQYDLGSKSKHVLEEGQRKRRKTREEAGVSWEPCWFKEVNDDVLDVPDYRFGGEFFRMQSLSDWSRCPDIFSCAADVKG